MKMRALVAIGLLLAILPAGAIWAQSADEQSFQAIAAALQANDTERQSAIDTCIAQGIGDNPTGAAQFLGVPVEKASSAWCHRITNSIAEGKLSLADLQGLNGGDVSTNAASVLKVPAPGE